MEFIRIHSPSITIPHVPGWQINRFSLDHFHRCSLREPRHIILGYKSGDSRRSKVKSKGSHPMNRGTASVCL